MRRGRIAIEYRAYLIDENEHIRDIFKLQATSSEEALRQAETLQRSQAMEIWEISAGYSWNRLLRRYEPEGLAYGRSRAPN